MENNMFCFQCQETAKGFGCTLKGVCGKNATTARTMDLLLFVVRGISVVADQLRQHSLPVEKEVDNFIVDALFCTITNANFDDESITKRIDKGLAIRDDLKHQASAKDIPLPEADELNWKGSHDEYDAKAATVGVLREQNEDLRSLKELIMYGLKGMHKRENVIILSAKDSIEDKVLGLELGADDYLPKPFHLVELNARIKSVIRRHQQGGENSIKYGNIEIFPDKYGVTVAGKKLELNRKEYDILVYFMNRPGRLVNKSTLAESVWGDHIDQVDNFDFIYAQIKNLRKRLKEAGATPELKAVYGFGYKMVVE